MKTKIAWILVGVIVALTIAVGVFFTVRREKHPDIVNIEESFAFIEEMVWANYNGMVNLASGKTLELKRIDGVFNKSISGRSMNRLGVKEMTETYVMDSIVYYVITDIGTKTSKCYVDSLAPVPDYPKINVIFRMDNYMPLYDAVRKVKWNCGVDTDKFEVISDKEGTIYYIFDTVRVNTVTKEIE